MTDQETKEKLIKAAREKLVEQMLPALKDPRNRLRTVVAMKILSLVDKELGKGVPRVQADWDRLREMVAKQEGAAELVSNLEGAVKGYAQEIEAKIRSGEVEEAEARAAAVRVIRLALLRKIKIGGAPPAAS